MRPVPPRSGGGGGKLAIGCVGVVVLAGVGFFVLQQRARARAAEFSKQYSADSDKIAAIEKRANETRVDRTSIDRCIASVNDKLAKAHGAKDDAPAAIPSHASLVCDTTSWQTGCRTPTVFAQNSAFDASALCAEQAGDELHTLEELLAKKPYPRDAGIDKWGKDVDAAIAKLTAARAKQGAPDMVAALTSACEATALESFVDNSTGARRQLEANTCQVAVTWVDAAGNVVGRLKATGHGKPSDASLKAFTLSDSEMDAANDESERNAIDDGFAQVQKRIDQINNKKGGSPSKPTAPSPAPASKPAAPAKPAAPPSKPAASSKPAAPPKPTKK
jgi:hypothetical protein